MINLKKDQWVLNTVRIANYLISIFLTLCSRYPGDIPWEESERFFYTEILGI